MIEGLFTAIKSSSIENVNYLTGQATQIFYIELHMLKFYADSGIVIAKSIKGNDINYFKNQIFNFEIDGALKVKAEPEITFMGAFLEGASNISFKVENEVNDTSWPDEWQKDIISFHGNIINHKLLQLKVKSQKKEVEVERVYCKNEEQEWLVIIQKELAKIQ